MWPTQEVVQNEVPLGNKPACRLTKSDQQAHKLLHVDSCDKTLLYSQLEICRCHIYKYIMQVGTLRDGEQNLHGSTLPSPEKQNKTWIIKLINAVILQSQVPTQLLKEWPQGLKGGKVLGVNSAPDHPESHLCSVFGLLQRTLSNEATTTLWLQTAGSSDFTWWVI